jgi:hypothetical protein
MIPSWLWWWISYLKSNFIPTKSTHKTDDIARIFIQEIFRLHGLPKAIVFDKDIKFTSNVWNSLFEYFGTHLNFSIAYHPHIDGLVETIN